MKRFNNNQATQRIDAPVELLGNVNTGGGPVASAAGAVFRVPMVDARFRVILSIIFVPAAGTNLDANAAGLAGTMQLWIFGEMNDRSGVAGVIFPVSNVEGTKAAPTVLPIAGLYGYSREFVTGADSVGGVVSFGTPPTNGSWMLEVTYQPEAGVVLSESDWEQIYAQCNPQVIARS